MNKIFIINVINLLGFNDFTLVKEFQSDIFSGFFVFGYFYFAKPTLTEDSSYFIIFQLELSDSLSFSFLHGMF
jgi:hypothetical protein